MTASAGISRSGRTQLATVFQGGRRFVTSEQAAQALGLDPDAALVGVTVDRFVELFAEPAALHDVGTLHGADLVVDQPAQQSHLQVRLVFADEAVEEFVGQERQLRGSMPASL